jgi:xanthine dehydrogenase accessory factor
VLEIAQIGRILEQLGDEPSWLVTVVAVEGSAYRRPGARLLFGREGKLAGGISAGCLEREVMRTGDWLAQRGAVLRMFDVRRDEDGEGTFRSGCNGKLQLLIEPVTEAARAALLLAKSELGAERPVAVATLLAGGPAPVLGAKLVQSSARSFSSVVDPALTRELGAKLSELLGAKPRRSLRYRRGSLDALLEVVEPEPHVSVFGTGEDAVPVAKLVTALGWNVTVRAQHGGFGVRDRFSGVAPLELGNVIESVRRLSSHAKALAVVMTHDYEQDRETLAALLASDARYIGVLGPAARTQRMLAELQTGSPYSAERLACVYGPAGLHLGADTPEAIALSIVAEMQAVLAGAQAGFLRSRSAGIHEQLAPLRLLQAEGA